ncbi:hypothetical protein EXIGLDRAFT_701187 [Exidia glandulosa HHB12029]|uniref:Uncharacterized protein n=1 Tax=Exidia glandulosa HHB12029 TaxID=1314781 RepID=A0A165LVP0_EXIGL|nr:hypothetical protein EXIGLDRAFT_701187 [Exidia glandulosa HHB12029]
MKCKFVAYTGPQAASRSSKGKPYLAPRSVASEISLDKVMSKYAQTERQAIQALYQSGSGLPPVDIIFDVDENSQSMAARMLDEHGLRLRSGGTIKFKWRVSSSWKSKVGSKFVRLLVQCACGYRQESKFHPNPWPFAACLAHAEVTASMESGQILRVRGYLDHTDACIRAVPDAKLMAAPKTNGASAARSSTPPTPAQEASAPPQFESSTSSSSLPDVPSAVEEAIQPAAVEEDALAHAIPWPEDFELNLSSPNITQSQSSMLENLQNLIQQLDSTTSSLQHVSIPPSGTIGENRTSTKSIRVYESVSILCYRFPFSPMTDVALRALASVESFAAQLRHALLYTGDATNMAASARGMDDGAGSATAAR